MRKIILTALPVFTGLNNFNEKYKSEKKLKR